MNRSSARTRLILLPASAALLGCLLVGSRSPHQAAHAYLAAYVFFLGPALGSLALLLIHELTGGAWGCALRPALLAATRMLPTMALLLLPVLLCMRLLFPWMTGNGHGNVPGVDAHLSARQHWYLNEPFFVLRAIGCFAIWLWLARRTGNRLQTPTPAGEAHVAAVGLILYALTVTVAGVDWMMSLVPAWHSSTFGLTIGTSQMFSAGALAVLCCAHERPPLRDLGSLLLLLILAWSYLMFMDYLTAWSADLPSETAWYLPRLTTSWRWVAVALVLCGLLLPFFGLLSQRAKQNLPWLRAVAAVMLLAQALYMLWVVLPSVELSGIGLGWSDALAWAGIGGVCWFVFERALTTRRPARERPAGVAP